MEQPRFEQIVARLEQESAAAPAVYRFKVGLLALFGALVMLLILAFAGFSLLLIAGVVVLVLMTGGKVLLLVLKFAKVLWLLAVPAWYLVRSSVSALFTRLPTPQGIPLTQGDAPMLFAAMDAMRQRMKGPRFHTVLIVDELNAAVVQRPLFGLIGWPRNYLILGLPLLESLAPDEALAVVAHEYGHLAGSHSHFGAFIYRLRHTWTAIETATERWRGLGTRPVRRVVGWYAPYFNAYTFVLARANEYQADAASARLVGAPIMANALKRLNLASARYGDFMEQTLVAARDASSPPRDLALRWAREAMVPLAPERADDWLARALDRATGLTDSHPALRLRLLALPGQASVVGLRPPELDGPSAARAWLGERLASLRERLQGEWHARTSEPWAERHEAVQAQRRRLAELEALPAPAREQQLERLRLRTLVQPEVDHLPALQDFNAAHTDDVLGLFLEAGQRLDRGDETGLALLDRVMTLDASATRPACERAHRFLDASADARAAAYVDRWNARATWERTREQQRATLDLSHEFRDADELDEGARARIAAILRLEHKSIAKAFVARRVLPADPDLSTYVVAIMPTRWARLRRQQSAIMKRLAAQEWPMVSLICSLDGKYAPLLQKLESLPHAAIAFAA